MLINNSVQIFFDLIIIDECHRGSVKGDSKWREILACFDNATHVGLTAIPKETKEVSNQDYFSMPIYTYSLKQGIYDDFLAPYKVVKITLDIDAEGWRPPKGFKDKAGNLVEDRVYNRTDYDKTIIVEDRRKLVADKITEFLKGHGRLIDNTIVQKVESLMQKCTALEAEIKHSEKYAQQLIQAVIKEAFKDKSNKISVSQAGKEEI